MPFLVCIGVTGASIVGECGKEIGATIERIAVVAAASFTSFRFISAIDFLLRNVHLLPSLARGDYRQSKSEIASMSAFKSLTSFTIDVFASSLSSDQYEVDFISSMKLQQVL